MTEEELDRLEELWNEKGLSVKEICSELGYTYAAINFYMNKDRKRFPYRRRPTINEEQLSLWIARILSGRSSIANAARQMGVCHETIARRLRRIKKDEQARMAQGEGQA